MKTKITIVNAAFVILILFGAFMIGWICGSDYEVNHGVIEFSEAY